MQNERESFSALRMQDYNIAGNLLHVFSNADGKVVFVIDLLVDETKPNVLLVINPVDNRKWDDILENDYSVDLETVRPKKDNKYQKLDIEYSGLSVYLDLIDAYKSGKDLTNALVVLNDFRKIAVRRAAAERLVAAETAADNAQETIEKANNAIAELNVRTRDLRAKLSELRKNIGKEPTKHSAAKILRVESQIDATNEKIRRAKKRMENAQKRLVAATDDAEVARDILAKSEEFKDIELPATVPEKPVLALQDETFTDFYPVVSENENNTIITNTKAEKMADEEVKPLFDTDPEILDEEIAFKPIDFSAPVIAPEAPVVPVEPKLPDAYRTAPETEPLAFTPPVATETFRQEIDGLPEQTPVAHPAPVLDSITAVDTPAGMAVTETQTEFIPQPVMSPYAAPVAEPAAAEPDVAPAPMNSGFRPVSPITGVAPVEVAQNVTKQKQGAAYYIMLFVLIALSIFVLWYYQKTTGGSVLPNIGAAVVAESTEPEVVPEELVTETVEPVAVIAEPEPVQEPVQEPEPTPVEPVAESEPEPVVIEAEPVAVEPTEIVVPVTVPVVTTVPTVVPEPEVVKIETEEEILAKKPAYGVSQNETMFVADDKFETDRLGDEIVDETEVVDMYDTPIVPVQEAEPIVQYQEPESAEEYIEVEVLGCEGGAAPDKFGCCPGETYTQIDNGGFVCCPDAGGDCFPPL